jgi:uncharacterized membrane-anchored protein YitT (DUF2179 family)
LAGGDQSFAGTGTVALWIGRQRSKKQRIGRGVFIVSIVVVAINFMSLGWRVLVRKFFPAGS